mgnify:CR=1 FL=1|tara:strand:+ start:2027 stop:2230 length:204 start_codon:yes stop_codon:yes gene_type:complete
MNLFLRPLDNPNDPVWSVIVMIAILLVGVSFYIAYILRMKEDSNGSVDTTKQEELLQLPCSEDQQGG